MSLSLAGLGLFGPPLIPADLHLHTSHSHGKAGTDAMFLAARIKRLSTIGFAEHSPRPAGYVYPVDYQDKLTATFPRYVNEVLALSERAALNGINVLLGLEADFIPGQEKFTAALCRSYPFDYIIGGLHFQGDWGFDFSAEDWKELDLDARFAVYAAYYNDLCLMCQTRQFQIAAHPDLIKIFSIETFRQWLDTDEALPLIKKALTAMKDNHMLLEVSSAGLRKPCEEIYPGPRIMALAKELDLPISFGSDAHCANTPAYAFKILARYAASFGYRYSCVPSMGRVKRLPFSAPVE
ncbi:histidinol-phosphatase [Desulfovibrio sp. OttesenSCG-928-G11]|nr:histidinol-phosphatase [Desulfovibrio sp. OttesenSCG-928-G11]